jgi:hypothetical protein
MTNYLGYDVELGDDGYWHVFFAGSDLGAFALKRDAHAFVRKMNAAL